MMGVFTPRRRRQEPPEDERQPIVEMDFALRTIPGPGSEDQGGNDSSQPLQHHQGREQPIRPAEDPLPLLLDNPLTGRDHRRVTMTISNLTDWLAGDLREASRFAREGNIRRRVCAAGRPALPPETTRWPTDPRCRLRGRANR